MRRPDAPFDRNDGPKGGQERFIVRTKPTADSRSGIKSRNPDDRRDLALGHVALVALTFVVLSETLGSYNFTRLTNALIAAGLSSLLLLSARTRRTYLVSPVAVIFVGFAALSGAWSAYPNAALGGALILVAVLYASIVLGSVTSTREIAVGIIVAQLLLLALSVLQLFLDPGVAIVSEQYQSGTFRGIFGHRNLFAFHMLIGLAAAISVVRLRWPTAVLQLGIAAAFFAAIIASQSATAIVVAVLLVVLNVAVLVIQGFGHERRRAIGAVVAGLCALGALLVVLNLDRVLGILGRNATLTNRTGIWEAIAHEAAKRPLFGYGWDSVWGSGRSPGTEINDGFSYQINHAHSIYFELWLVLGFVGLGFLLASLLLIFGFAARGVLVGISPSPMLWLSLVVVLAVHGLAETMLVRPLGMLIFFLLLIGAVRDSRTRGWLPGFLCVELNVDARPLVQGESAREKA